MKALGYEFFLVVVGLLFLMSCEHTVTMETQVHPDGVLDKSITLTGDSSLATHNFLGISATKGWTVAYQHDSSDQDKVKVQFKRQFNSAEAFNHAFGNPSDTTFRMTSNFDKKFRWFYTYYLYSETFQAINRLTLPISDYFVPEDFEFIDRLSPEGHSLTKADSLYLDRLHEKIFDIYGTRAIFEKYCAGIESLLEKKLVATWIDTLRSYKEKLYVDFVNDENADSTFYRKFSAIPGFPVNPSELEQLWTEFEHETDFYSVATNAEYVNIITMPGSLVQTNADSVNQNTGYWKPRSTRFLLKDYVMTAESRQMNGWAWIVTGVIVMAAIFLNTRRSKSQN